jgi:hypothetical protein
MRQEQNDTFVQVTSANNASRGAGRSGGNSGRGGGRRGNRTGRVGIWVELNMSWSKFNWKVMVVCKDDM